MIETITEQIICKGMCSSETPITDFMIKYQEGYCNKCYHKHMEGA